MFTEPLPILAALCALVALAEWLPSATTWASRPWRCSSSDASALLSTPIPIPNDPNLVGRSVPFQGVAWNGPSALRLTDPIDLALTR